MTIDNIFKRFLKEEGIYNTSFKNVKFSRYVDSLFSMYYPSSRIIREEKDFWKRQDLMYKFDRLDKKWKYRAKNIFIQHNIDMGDIVVTDDGHEGVVARISPFGICFVNGNTSTSCSFRRIVEIRGKKLFKNIYFKFKRKTYGKADGEFHEMLLTYY